MKMKNLSFTLMLLCWGGFLLAQPDVLQDARFKGSFGARFSAGSGMSILTDGSPDNETNYRARFYLNTNNLNLPGTNQFTLLCGRNPATPHFELIVTGNGAFHSLSLRTRLDSSATVSSSQVAMVRGWQAVEVRWRTGPGNGEVALVIDGNEVATLANLDNDQGFITSVVLGYDFVTGTGDSGSFDVDDFDSRKLSPPGLQCLTNEEFLGFLADWPSLDVLDEMDLLNKRCIE